MGDGMAEKEEEKVMSAYLDRVEKGKAVLLFGEDAESMEQLTVPAWLLPEGVAEGDYVRIAVSYDRERTEAAEAEAVALLEETDRDRPV